MNVTEPVDPPLREQCQTQAPGAGGRPSDFGTANPQPDPTQYIAAPTSLMELGSAELSEGRLIKPLRALAQAMNPVATPINTAGALSALEQAAIQFLPGESGNNLGAVPALAFALADLAVTGRHALAAYLANTPTAAQLTPLVSAHPAARGSSVADIQWAVNTALTRARNVLQALKGDLAFRQANRPALGYIAVSGEDDLPIRPVNVPGASFPQYDLTVNVPFNVNYRGGDPKVIEYKIQTRYMIASSIMAGTPVVDPALGFPTDRVPNLPSNGLVFLYVHGHMSRLEEACDLARAFHELATEDLPITVISMDLPGMGYAASPIDPGQSSFPSAAETKYPSAFPNLDFIEQFILAFVDALDPLISLKKRLTAVVGGSLGGHMGLRLSRRSREFPWLKHVVSWSPISVGPSLANRWIIGRLAKRRAGSPAGTAEVVSDDTSKDSRFRYFDRVFNKPTAAIGGVTILPPQPRLWYREDWQPCKELYIAGARLERREIYRTAFRQWHWRVGMECTLYSFLDPDPGQSNPRYLSMSIPMLLAAGSEDDDIFVKIFTNTRALARLMVNTPGTTLFLLSTGHSIHNERPGDLARAILNFVQSNPSSAPPP
jgi:pimeloyl-ACP methyl ester carboxylesterase